MDSVDEVLFEEVFHDKEAYCHKIELRDAVAAERERCAKLAEDHICGCGDHGTEIGRQIRNGLKPSYDSVVHEDRLRTSGTPEMRR